MTTRDNLKFLNTDFRVVYNREKTATAPRIRRFLGRNGLVTLLGERLANDVVERAYRANSLKITCKFRSGYQVIFYAK